jgi:hypothetical protein
MGNRLCSKPFAALLTLLALARSVSVAQPAAGAEAGKPGSGGLRYTAAISPPHPEVGDLIVFDLRVDGASVSSSKVEEFRLGPGLSLESESLRPFVSASGRGVAFHFELRVLEAGEGRIESLTIHSADGRLKLGPIVVGEAKASPESLDSRPLWRWIAPAEALRYEAFEARLEPESGSSSSEELASEGGAASFIPPTGASFEASGRLSWTVIAFDEGELSLPEVSLRGRRGVAKSAGVAIRALPSELAATRAIGSFALRIEDPEPTHPVAGAALRLRFLLEGRGNLPLIVLPEPVLSLEGKAISRGAWSSRRSDNAKAEGGSYVGSTSLIVDLIPAKPGLLSLRIPTMTVFDPRVGETKLEVPALELLVAKADSRDAASKAGGQALAELYGELRRAAPCTREARAARKAAYARSSEIGAGAPLLDALPPPLYFFIPACIVALMGLGLFILSRIRVRKARAFRALSPSRGGTAAAWAASLAIALAFGAFGLVSSAERKSRFVVVWADSLQTVPSAESERGIAVTKGSTARARGSSGGYESVVLADGVEGWVPRESLFWY